MFYRKVHILLIGCFCFIHPGAFAQDQKIADSLARIYQQNTLTDTAKYNLLIDLSFNETRDLKKSLQYADELITSAEQAGNNVYLRRGYYLKGNIKRKLGNLPEALEAYFKSAEIARKAHNLKGEAESYGAVADSYSEANDHPNAKLFYQKAIPILRRSNDSISLASVLCNTGNDFLKTSNYDSALLYFTESKVIFDKANYLSGKGYSVGGIGMVYANTGKNELAEKNINEAILILEEVQDYSPVCDYLISLSDVYLSEGDQQKALNYALRSLQLAEQYALKTQIAAANLKVSDLYEKKGNLSFALKYYKTHIAYRDSVNNLNSVQRMADLRTNYEVSQKQLEVNRLNQQKLDQKHLLFVLGIVLGFTVIILSILMKYHQTKQKAYKILDLQKQETDKQKAKAEAALHELQVTQKQLIHSAKMASLGELAAGIAHEIQNPLNFVNNFSEVTVDLLAELKEEVVNKLPVLDKASAEEIMNDLADNLKKIGDHGKRADSIVKGMLQHSRISSNKKEAVDINALTDEYLQLSYHGLRAKDNSFNIALETDFDNLEKLLVVPQDIGRVLINIYNNAFYSVQQKTKLNINGYEPKLRVSTKGIMKDGKLKAAQIHIRDNGMGIPDKIADKIFQPFFTTKPTGQGTGLGLSLSYDIITNEHNGELKVETKEGEYTEFIIELPKQKMRAHRTD